METFKKMMVQSRLPQQVGADKQVEDTQSEVGDDDTQLPPGIRNTGRTRKLTEKGNALLDDKLKNLNASLLRMYRRWKCHMNELRVMMLMI